MKYLAHGFVFTLLAMLVSSIAAAEETIVIVSRDIPDGFSTTRNLTTENSRILDDFYEGLTRVGRNKEVLPAVAESWTISEEGRIWQFHIRDDARWSDGEQITAQTIVDSIKVRADNARNGQPTGDYGLDLIVGYADYVTSTETAFSDIGVSAVDAKTLEFKLITPSFYFLEITATTAFIPIPLHAIDETTGAFQSDVVVNGAYMPTQSDGSAISAERNPLYHDVSNVFFDKVEYRRHDMEDDTAFSLLQKGEPFVWLTGNQEVAEWFDANRPEYVVRSADLAITYLDINFDNPHFSDPEIRKALAISLDRQRLIEADANGGSVSKRWLPSSLPGLTDIDYLDDYLYEDLEEAKAILAERGFDAETPLSFDFFVPDTGDGVAAAMRSQWARVGFDANIHINTLSDHYLEYLVPGEFDVALAGWSGETNDPYYQIFFAHSDTEISDIFNFGSAKNDVFDGIVNEMRFIQDETLRIQSAEDAEHILMSDYMKIPILEPNIASIISPEIKGLGTTPGVRIATRLLYLGD